MNVLKPNLQITVKTLLNKDISQHEISRKTGIDRKTIRKYARANELVRVQEAEHSKSPMATGSPAGGLGLRTPSRMDRS